MMKGEIGKRIKQRRQEKKITLQQMGERINYDYSNLSKIERGEYEASYEILKRLADELDVSVGYFFGERIETPDDIDDEWEVLKSDFKQDELTPEEIRKYVEVARRLLDDLS